MPTVAEKRAAFRELHEAGFFIIPNAWDAGSAVRLAGLGFQGDCVNELGRRLGGWQGRWGPQP